MPAPRGAPLQGCQPHRPVSPLLRLGYGVGQFIEGVKSAAFTFVFFFYTQVLGVPAGPAGLVLFVATVFDAITDPMMGSISDRTRHRWGPRLIYLYAAAVPTGIAFALMFLPPASWSPTALTWWLLGTAVLVRGVMTIVHVPYLALGADLSDNYTERTAIVAARTAFGMGGLGVMLAVAWGVFFKSTPEFPNGQLNAAAYPGFGLVCAVASAVVILVAALSTHRRVAASTTEPRVATTTEPRDFSPGVTAGAILTDWRDALSNRSFRLLLIGLLAFGTMRGVQETLSVHLFTYFWRLAPAEILQVFVAGLASLVAAIPVWTAAARRFDKKPVLITGAAGFAAVVVTIPLLGLFGWFPSRESSAFLPTLLLGYVVAGALGSAVFVASGSMLADVAGVLRTHHRRGLTAVVFGASALSFKVTTGLGGWLAGLVLAGSAFPVGVQPGEVPAGALRGLVLGYGPGAGVLAIVAVMAFSQYTLPRVSGADVDR